MLIELIAVPYDSGIRDIRMGRGPRHLLEADLPGHLTALGHEVHTTILDVPTTPLTPEPRFLVELSRRLAADVAASRRRGAFPLVLAGSCYVSLGILAGLGDDDTTGVFWFDSHADLNTPATSASGFLDGMAVSLLTGSAWQQLLTDVPGRRPLPERNVCLVGVRDVDPPERATLERSAIHHCRSPADAAGLQPVLAAMRDTVRQVYLHLDLDVLDPAIGKANDLAAPDGLTVREISDAIRAIGQTAPIAAAAVTAYDPALDGSRAVQRAAFDLIAATVETAAGAP